MRNGKKTKSSVVLEHVFRVYIRMYVAEYNIHAVTRKTRGLWGAAQLQRPRQQQRRQENYIP